jgi:hypothetical protein
LGSAVGKSEFSLGPVEEKNVEDFVDTSCVFSVNGLQFWLALLLWV